MLTSGKKNKVIDNISKVVNLQRAEEDKKKVEQQTLMRVTPVQKQTTESQSSQELAKDATDSKCCVVSKRAKIIIAVSSIFVILLAISLSVGLTLALKPKTVSDKPPTQYFFPEDQSAMRITELNTYKMRLSQPNLQVRHFRSQVVTSRSRRSLQQENNEITYIDTINFEKEGIVARVHPDKSIEIHVDPDKFIDYLNTTDAEVPRMLQQTDNSNMQLEQDVRDTDDWKQLEERLSSTLSSELNEGKDVNVQYAEYLTFQFNPQTKIFQQVQESSDSTKRFLLQRRLLFRKLRPKIPGVINHVVKPSILLILKQRLGDRPAASVSAVEQSTRRDAGALALTPPRAGSYSQQFVKACIPQNSEKIKCDSKALITEDEENKLGRRGFGGKININANANANANANVKFKFR